jgi:hypothetical protein
MKNNESTKVMLRTIIDSNFVSTPTIEDMVGGYQHIKYHAVINGKVVKPTTVIIPSPGQRFKQSPAAQMNSKFIGNGIQSTWNEEHMGMGLITWFTNTANPQVLLNDFFYETTNVFVCYDGESKLHFIQHFVNGEDVFKVLEKRKGKIEFTLPIQEFKAKKNSYQDYKSLELIEMFDEFMAQRKESKHSSDYLTTTWMKMNGYDELLNRFLKNEMIVSKKTLQPEVESDIYQILGSCGAEQSVSQLSMAHIKSEMYNRLYYRNETPDDMMSKVLYNMIDPSVSKFHYLNKLFEQVNQTDKDGYKEYDVYFYNMFLFSFLHIDNSGKLYFSTDIDWDSMIPKFVRWTRNRRIIKFFKERTQAFTELSSNEQELLINKLTDKVVPVLNKLFEVIGQQKYHSKYRSANKNGIPKQIRTQFLSESQNVSNKVVDEKIIPLITKLSVNQDDIGIIIPMLFASQYIVSSSSLSKNDVENVLDNILDTYQSGYVNYLYGKESLAVFDTFDGYDGVRKDYKEMGYPKYESVGEVGSSLGVSGFGMEGTAHLMKHFLQTTGSVNLNEEFGDKENTAKVKRKLKSYVENKLGGLDKFRMVNPHGDIFDWYGFDIGHPIPDSVIGNTVTETHFIVEESNKNRNKYRTDNKDVVKYYSLSNMKLQELMDEAFSNRDNEMISKLTDVEKTLEFLVDYHGIELVEMDFDEEGYIEK